MEIEKIQPDLRPKLLRLLEDQSRFAEHFYNQLLQHFKDFKGQSRTFLISCLKETIDAETSGAIERVSRTYVIEEKEVTALRGKFISLVKTYLGTANGVKFVEELATAPQTANGFPFRSLQSTAKKGEKRKSLPESTPMKPSFTMPRLPVEKEKPLQNASSKAEKENEIGEERQKESVKKGGQIGKRKRFSEAEDDDSDEDYSPPVKTAAKRKSLSAGSKASSSALPLSRTSKTDDLLMRFDYNPIMSQAEKEIEDPKVLQLAGKLEEEKKIMWRGIQVDQLIDENWNYNGALDNDHLKTAVRMAFHLDVFGSENEFRYIARYISLKELTRNSVIRYIRQMCNKITEIHEKAKRLSEDLIGGLGNSTKQLTSVIAASKQTKQQKGKQPVAEPKDLGIPHGILTPRLPIARSAVNSNPLKQPIVTPLTPPTAQSSMQKEAAVGAEAVKPFSSLSIRQATVKLPVEKMSISHEQMTDKALINAANMIKSMIDAKLSEDPTPEIAAAAQSLNVSIRAFTNGSKDFNYRELSAVRAFDRSKVDRVIESTLQTIGCRGNLCMKEAVEGVIFEGKSMEEFTDRLEKPYLLRVLNMVLWSARESLRHDSSTSPSSVSTPPSTSATHNSSISPPTLVDQTKL